MNRELLWLIEHQVTAIFIYSMHSEFEGSDGYEVRLA